MSINAYFFLHFYLFHNAECHLCIVNSAIHLDSYAFLNLNYTHAVKLKSPTLEFRVTRILRDYATGRLRLHVLLILPKLKSTSSVVIQKRVSVSQFYYDVRRKFANSFPKNYHNPFKIHHKIPFLKT